MCEDSGICPLNRLLFFRVVYTIILPQTRGKKYLDKLCYCKQFKIVNPSAASGEIYGLTGTNNKQF